MTEAVKSAKRVAMLIEDEFEDGEVTGPVDALRAAGLDVVLVGPIAGRAYTGKRAIRSRSNWPPDAPAPRTSTPS
jgi:putative intracellular protease/amidase